MSSSGTNSSKSKPNPLVFWLGVLPGRTLAAISCFLLFVMMALTFIDVSGRYLFNSPLPALHEIISFMMPGLIFCALPMICRQEGHVTIDLLDIFLSKNVKRWQGLFVNIVSFSAMAFVSWRLAEKSTSHFEFGEVTDELYMDLWPFSLGMSILSAIAAIALIANVADYLTGTKTAAIADKVETA